MKPRPIIEMLLGFAVLVACSCDNSPEPRGDLRGADALADGAVETIAPDTGVDAAPDLDIDARISLPALRPVVDGRFATSIKCTGCHENAATATGMRDAAQRPVAPYDLWRATAMANAARDPFWRAVVAAEVEAAPSLAATIEAQCMRCHSPMAWYEANANGETPVALALLQSDTDRGQLALDGVSCTLCHQIQPDNLGTDQSYSANFTIDTSLRIFGPDDNLFSSPMISPSGGFEAVTGKHVQRAALCGSCHTLIVETIDDKGQPTGLRFPEQTPYLEWRNSVFNDEVAQPGAKAKSCQGCHMPVTDVDGAAIRTQVSIKTNGTDYSTVVVPQREPYARHLFVGGNVLLPTLLKRFAADLQPNASAAAFDEIIARVTDQLQTRTATVAISAASRSGAALDATVIIANLTGHKLPTAYPSRRIIVQLAVLDADGKELVVSGRLDAGGRLVDKNGVPLPSELAGGPTLAHLAVVDDVDRPQVYEVIAGDTQGKPTFHLLTAASYLKDNRILPEGWSDQHADIARIAPTGIGSDSDFSAGGDVVRYQLALPNGAKAPLTVRARLYYQTLWRALLTSSFEARPRPCWRSGA